MKMLSENASLKRAKCWTGLLAEELQDGILVVLAYLRPGVMRQYTILHLEVDL